jgi:oligoribonuclease
MTDLKHAPTTHILWVDLEMTGLNPKVDRILEVGAIATDWSFTELASLETGVRQDRAELEKLFAHNEFYDLYPENKQHFLDTNTHQPSEKNVEHQLIELIEQYFPVGEPVVLGGNSIHMDRLFIRQWWPELEKRLHYRMLDVSAWKIVMQGKFGIEYTKKESHRALDDIRESICELKFYLQKLENTHSN